MSQLADSRDRRGAVVVLVALVACGGNLVPRENLPVDAGSAAPSGTPAGQGTAPAQGGGDPDVGDNGAGVPVGSSSGSSDASMGSADGGMAGAEGGTSLAPDGGPLSPRGCELGTSCRPGDDLAAPPTADGFQIVTPPGAYTVQPNQETIPNYCVTVPTTTEFDVGTMQSWMTPGSSRELTVYRIPPASAGSSPGTCGLSGATPIYVASISGQVVELKMPQGAGIALQAGTQIVIAMHFINNGTSPLEPQVKVNFLRAANYQYEAGLLLSFNTMINVPAASSAEPGTQTVQGTCTAPVGSQFFAIGTHTNGHATAADVSFVSGSASTSVVHTTDWARPDVGVWPAPPFLTLEKGDSLDYSCSYSNGGTDAVTVGETQSNELCMMVGYYFPAGNASCQ